MHCEHFGARKVRRNGEAGFTLIELMMVVMIIAILIAVLVPIFLGASSRAKDRAMQSNLTTGLKLANVIYTDRADFTQATPGALTAADGGNSLTFVNAGTAPTGQSVISVDTVSADYVVLSGMSRSGTCFYVSDDKAGPGVLYARLGGAGGCAAGGAPLPGDPAWQQDW